MANVRARLKGLEDRAAALARATRARPHYDPQRTYALVASLLAYVARFPGQDILDPETWERLGAEGATGRRKQPLGSRGMRWWSSWRATPRTPF